MNTLGVQSKKMLRVMIERVGVVGASVLGAFCPLCIPAIGAFLASVGLGFLVHARILWWLMVIFIFLGLFGLSFSYRKEHGNFRPLLLGLFGALGIYGGRYVFGFTPLVYVGAGSFIAASVWNWVLRKQKRISELPPCCAAKGAIQAVDQK